MLHDIDGTPNFDRLGGNTASAVSTAVALAAADALDVPLHALVGAGIPTLPRPLGNIMRTAARRHLGREPVRLRFSSEAPPSKLENERGDARCHCVEAANCSRQIRVDGDGATESDFAGALNNDTNLRHTLDDMT